MLITPKQKGSLSPRSRRTVRVLSKEPHKGSFNTPSPQKISSSFVEKQSVRFEEQIQPVAVADEMPQVSLIHRESVFSNKTEDLGFSTRQSNEDKGRSIEKSKDLTVSLENSMINTSTNSGKRAKAVMLIEKDKREKTIWVRRVSQLERRPSLMPTGIKKRVVARPRKRKTMQNTREEEEDSFNPIEESKLDDTPPEPFQDEDPIKFNAIERQDLTGGRQSLNHSNDRIISSLNNSKDRIIGLEEMRPKKTPPSKFQSRQRSKSNSRPGELVETLGSPPSTKVSRKATDTRNIDEEIDGGDLFLVEQQKRFFEDQVSSIEGPEADTSDFFSRVSLRQQSVFSKRNTNELKPQSSYILVQESKGASPEPAFEHSFMEKPKEDQKMSKISKKEMQDHSKQIMHPSSSFQSIDLNNLLTENDDENQVMFKPSTKTSLKQMPTIKLGSHHRQFSSSSMSQEEMMMRSQAGTPKFIHGLPEIIEQVHVENMRTPKKVNINKKITIQRPPQIKVENLQVIVDEQSSYNSTPQQSASGFDFAAQKSDNTYHTAAFEEEKSEPLPMSYQDLQQNLKRREQELKNIPKFETSGSETKLRTKAPLPPSPQKGDTIQQSSKMNDQTQTGSSLVDQQKMKVSVCVGTSPRSESHDDYEAFTSAIISEVNHRPHREVMVSRDIQTQPSPILAIFESIQSNDTVVVDAKRIQSDMQTVGVMSFGTKFDSFTKPITATSHKNLIKTDDDHQEVFYQNQSLRQSSNSRSQRISLAKNNSISQVKTASPFAQFNSSACRMNKTRSSKSPFNREVSVTEHSILASERFDESRCKDPFMLDSSLIKSSKFNEDKCFGGAFAGKSQESQLCTVPGSQLSRNSRERMERVPKTFNPAFLVSKSPIRAPLPKSPMFKSPLVNVNNIGASSKNSQFSMTTSALMSPKTEIQGGFFKEPKRSGLINKKDKKVVQVVLIDSDDDGCTPSYYQPNSPTSEQKLHRQHLDIVFNEEFAYRTQPLSLKPKVDPTRHSGPMIRGRNQQVSQITLSHMTSPPSELQERKRKDFVTRKPMEAPHTVQRSQAQPEPEKKPQDPFKGKKDQINFEKRQRAGRPSGIRDQFGSSKLW